MSKQAQPSCFGRTTETDRIQNVLNMWLAVPKESNWFGILGISGYGGVGKSYLLDSVLGEIDSQNTDVFQIQIDGSNKRLLSDFFGMIDQKLASRSVSFKGSKAGADQFPETRKLLNEQRQLTAKVDNELDKSGAQNVVRAAKALYRFRPLISLIPYAGTALSIVLETSQNLKLEKYAEPAADLLKSLPAFNPRRPWPFGKLWMSPSERLALDPYETIASAYESDVRARLKGYQGKNVFKLMNRRAPGVNRMLLVIDDYETTGAVLGDLLVDNLLPGFSRAPYPVLVIIVGRDDLWDANPGFSKSLAPFVKDRIRLEPFTREEAVQFLETAGYSEEEALKVYTEANGYPFVLSLLSDREANQDDRPAIFYQQFYERTTQWMTLQQKKWLLLLCYLDEVNRASIEKMIPEAPAELVMDWFRKEASVRDVEAPSFRVEPYIRKMLLQHDLNLNGPAAQRDLIEKGRLACNDASSQ